MKVLITGVTGFTGSHLAEFLLGKENIEIHGIERWRSKTENIEHIRDKIILHECDIRDASSVRKVMEVIKPDRIFHLAAQSFVPTSWMSPAETLSTNIIGQLNIFESCLQIGINPRIQLACCYDKETKVFTDSGLKAYKDLTAKDKVLSINSITREVEFKKIKDIIIQSYDGRMYHFKSRSCDVMVTPNHKMLVRRKDSQQLEFVEADKLTGRNIVPLGRTNGKKQHFSEEMYYLLGLFVGDGYIVPCKKTLEWSGLSHNEYIKLRNKKGQFIKLAKKKYKEYISQRVFLAVPQKDKARVPAETALRKLGIKYSAYSNELYFNPTDEMLNILRQCGKGAKNKRIPKFVLDSNVKCLEKLFKGLIDSDGSYRKNRYCFFTSSDGLMQDVIELCSKIGKWVTVTEGTPRTANIGKRKIISDKIYNLSITEGEKILTKTSQTNKKIVDYKGIIWCVEVEDNHNLLVERNGKVMFCGNSSEEYGLVYENETPITEGNPLRPLSPYGVSKVGQDLLGYQYFMSYKLHIIRTRAFNHSGPRRGEVFVCSNFAKQVAEIEKGKREPVISVGNLEAKRDFTDVRDTVKGYWLALEKGEAGDVYNICSQKAYSIKELLNMLLAQTKLEIKIKQDPARMRPSDVPILLGDCSKFMKKTGWRPTIPFERTLEDLLNYWRERV